MRVLKAAAVAIATGTMSLAQTVDLHGSVTIAGSATPLDSVVVVLVGQGLSDTTDANGQYAIQRLATGLVASGGRTRPTSLCGRTLAFSFAEPQEVAMGAVSLDGRTTTVVSGLILPAGIHTVDLSRMLPGARCLVVDVGIGGRHSFFRYLNQRGNAVGGGGGHAADMGGLGKRAAAVDSLVFSRSGYETLRLGIDSLTGIVNASMTSVPQPPTIVTQPQPQLVQQGQTATFRVAASGSAPLLYQWQRDGLDIPNATAADYTTPPALPADNASLYRCIVSNPAGSVLSSVAKLSVVLSAGDAYQGGVVAYVLQPGDPGFVPGEVHGLVAAPSDQSVLNAEWGCYGTSIPTSNSLGAGAANTMAIVGACGQPGTAARICSDLVLNGYDDWYLPSLDELNKLYVNRAAIGGFDCVWGYYWSSSQYDLYDAWRQYFPNGSQYRNTKIIYSSVRAVRSF